MDRADPFTGYSVILRVLIYGVIPAFTAWQFIRLRRALHVFQLESYKRHWFRRWCAENTRRALFLRRTSDAKKPLVMTGRAWRMVVTATILSLLAILVPSAAAHLLGGAPYDLITAAVTMAAVFWFAPQILVAADVLMTPVQNAVNGRFLKAATGKLRDFAPTVVGVTGSFGKTSTKVAVARLLGAPAEVLATPGSFNTPLGVSRTINEDLERGHRWFVVEMGARQEGDVAEICAFVDPTIGVLTSIGPAHLESFGSLEAVRRAKYELIHSLPSSGTAVMNVDDEDVRRAADSTDTVEVIRYGIDESGIPNVTARDLMITERGTALTIVDRRSGAQVPVQTRLLGRHAVGHVLAGVAVALASGRSLDELTDAIESLEPVEHRLQIIPGAGGVTVIDDAYNSNPSGAAAAIEVLERMPGRRKVVVTPGMVELGDLQATANEEFGRRAALTADTLIVVAPLNRDAIVSGAKSVRSDVELIIVDSLKEATARLRDVLGAGDVVLFENDLPDQYEG
ncbi:MAG: UDP-N-acetylmuramoyl-tripeptide--D-alanyl-D-alanine ligase [Actinomycetota bacterium]